MIGWTLAAFLLSVAVGGIAGGMISNRLGAKRLIVGALLFAHLPLYFIFFLVSGSLSYFTAVMLARTLINAGMPIYALPALIRTLLHTHNTNPRSLKSKNHGGAF